MNTELTGKFINILKTFSKEEIKDFEKWLNFPFTGSGKNLLRLFEKIKKHHPHYDYRLLTKERLFKHLFPKKNYNADWLNNILSKGYLQAEDFLVCQNALQNKNLRADLLATEFQNRHLEDSFFKLTDQESERLEEKEIKDWEDHLDLLRLNRRVYHHPNQNPRMKPGSPTIMKMNDNLTLVFLLEKAAIINEMIFRNRILKNENHDIAKELKVWRTAAEGVDDLAIELYRKRFGYTEENMVDEYFELREMFFERVEELNIHEKRIHLISLINDSSFLRSKRLIENQDFLNLYKFGLETTILISEGLLTKAIFTTIVVLSNSVKDFEFTSFFVENYAKHLAFELQKDGNFWALAHTEYRKKNLDSATKILLENDFKSSHFQLLSKSLTLQCYFDLTLIDNTNFSFFIGFSSTFEKWMLREKIYSKDFKNSFIRFIQISRKLLKAHSEANFSEDALSELFKHHGRVQAINWLKEKKQEIILLKNKKVA